MGWKKISNYGVSNIRKAASTFSCSPSSHLRKEHLAQQSPINQQLQKSQTNICLFFAKISGVGRNNIRIWTYPTKTTRSQYDINDKIGCWNIWKLGMWGLRVGQSPRDDRASHRQQQLNYFIPQIINFSKFFMGDCGCPCLPPWFCKISIL